MRGPPAVVIASVADRPVSNLAGEAEWRLPDEAGGVLVGYRNGGAIVITGSIDAGPNAERWPEGLRPDRVFQNTALDRLFVETDGATTFVGEWHSHPLAQAIPSRHDRKTLRNTVMDQGSATAQALMLILERDDDEVWWGLLAGPVISDASAGSGGFRSSPYTFGSSEGVWDSDQLARGEGPPCEIRSREATSSRRRTSYGQRCGSPSP